MGKKKTLAPRAAPAPKAATKGKCGTQVTPPTPQQRISSRTRSQKPPNVDNAASGDENVGEEGATSSDRGNDTEPITPNPKRVGTRTTNTTQHPGDLHNVYTTKRRTKSELLEARRIEAEKKAAEAEEADRQAMRHEESMRRVADYEERLGQADVDKTPLSQPLRPLQPLRRTYASLDLSAAVAADDGDDEGPSNVPDGQRQRRHGSVTPDPMEAHFAERDEDDEGMQGVEESDATNQRDEDYIQEESEDSDELMYAEIGPEVVARGEKRKPKSVTEITEVVDSGDDGETRPKKKSKGSASVDPRGKEPPAKVAGGDSQTKKEKPGPRSEAHKDPRGDDLPKRHGDTSLKEGGNSKKKKEKPGVLLRDAVTALRSEAQEQNRLKDSGTRGDDHRDIPKSRDMTQKNSGIIKDWAATVSKFSSKPTSTAGSSRTLGSIARSSTTQLTSQPSTASTKKAIEPAFQPALSDNESNGLSDHDETIGNERDAALNSPPKNGARATSSGIVKIEVSGTTKVPGDKPRGKSGRKAPLTNKDLPDDVHKKDRWHKNFIPTFFWWVGQQPDPWNLADEDVVNALQEIWDVVYKKIPYTVEAKDAVVSVALQRACDSWRGTVGSTAITIVNSVYENSGDDFVTDDDRQTFASQQLETLEFLYGNIQSKPFRQYLRGDLVLHTLAAHYCAIQGAVEVPSLGDKDLLHNQPYGALGLSAAALERAFTLTANGNVTVETVRQSKMTRKKLVFKQGESDVKGETNFSERNWGKVSRDYIYSAKHELHTESKNYIFTKARHLAKDMARHSEDQSATSEAQPEKAALGRRALLVDIL